MLSVSVDFCRLRMCKGYTFSEGVFGSSYRALTVPLVLKDWLDNVVLLVCPDSVEREDSLVCLGRQ